MYLLEEVQISLEQRKIEKINILKQKLNKLLSMTDYVFNSEFLTATEKSTIISQRQEQYNNYLIAKELINECTDISTLNKL